MSQKENPSETKKEESKENEKQSNTKKDEPIICRECHQEGHMSYNCPK